MFTPCWKTCFHIVWNMFTQYSKTYLHRVERNSYSMLEDLILSCLKMHLHNVWRQFSIIFENMLTQYLETFFCIMFERMLCYVWRPVDTTFQACLKTYSYNVGRHAYTKLMTFVTNLWSHFHYNLFKMVSIVESKANKYPKDVWIVFQAIWSVKMPQSGVGSMQGSNEDCLPMKGHTRGGDAPTM